MGRKRKRYKRLSDAEKIKIIEYHRMGLTRPQIARKLNIHYCTVDYLLNRAKTSPLLQLVDDDDFYSYFIKKITQVIKDAILDFETTPKEKAYQKKMLATAIGVLYDKLKDAKSNVTVHKVPEIETMTLSEIRKEIKELEASIETDEEGEAGET